MGYPVAASSTTWPVHGARNQASSSALNTIIVPTDPSVAKISSLDHLRMAQPSALNLGRQVSLRFLTEY
jgi:hypothetical protein